MYRNLYVLLVGCLFCWSVFWISFQGSSRGRADFVFNNNTEPQSLDPGIMTGQPEGALANCMFEGLTTYHPKTLEPMPGVAASWEIDGTRHTFHLRRDCYWIKQGEIFISHGQPRVVTAQDFIYAWRRHLHPETGSEYAFLLHFVQGVEEYQKEVSEQYSQLTERYRAEHPQISLRGLKGLLPADYDATVAFRERRWRELVKIQTPDDFTLELELKSPIPFFLEITSFYPLFPVPAEAIAEHGDNWTLPQNIVSNGPFWLESWRFNAYIRLAKNKHYWENPEFAELRLAELERKLQSKGKLTDMEKWEKKYLEEDGPFIDRGMNTVDVLAVEQINTSLNLYLNGEVDQIRELPNEIRADLVEAAAKPGNPLPHLQHDLMNAVYYYNVYVQNDFYKRYPEAGKKLRRAMALAIDRPALIRVAARGGQKPAYRLVPDLVPNYASEPLFGSGDPELDLQTAQQLMAEIRAAGITPPAASILYNTSSNHEKIAAFIQSCWQKIRVSVTLTNQEWGVFLDAKRNGKFDISRSAWIGDFNDPQTYLVMFTSDNSNNDPKYLNPWYDRIVLDYCSDILKALATPASRTALLADIRSWPEYERVVLPLSYRDEASLDRSLAQRIEAYPQTAAEDKLALAFQIRLQLFAVAEAMLIEDMPIIPIYFYTITQLWPTELKNFIHNARDAHPGKWWRWRDGSRPTGSRYHLFPSSAFRDE